MARKHEAVDWLKKGCSPSEIAQKMGISTGSVLGYLYNQVGEGKIRRSDIIYAIPKDLRDAIEDVIKKSKKEDETYIKKFLRKNQIKFNEDDIKVYLKLRVARIVMGDMYEILRDIEKKLHEWIKKVLIEVYGESDWWQKGIPRNVRKNCWETFDSDDDERELSYNNLYSYTTLINLKEIFNKEWKHFEQKLPKGLRDKQKLLNKLSKMNQTRNKIMHPVRKKPVSEDEFSFLREFKKEIMEIK